MATIAEIRAKYPQYEDMSDQQLADAIYRKSYSDMPREEFDAKIGLSTTGYAAATANASRMSQLKGGPGKYQPPGDNLVSQSLSGVNEGIANMLGAPVEIANSVIGAGMAGVNALAGTDFKPTPLPVGGQQFFRDLMSPTIGAEATTPLGKGVRRVAEEVGAFAVPGIGVVGKAAKPLKAAASELAAAVGSGAGAAVAEQVFPGNPIAELAGQFVGGMTPAGVARAVKPVKLAPKMTVEQLQAAKDAAYKAADSAGVAYTPQGYDKMLADIVTRFKKDRFNPKRHEAAMAVFETLASERGKNLTLTELDQLRQIIRRDVVNPSYKSAQLEADGHFGELMLDAIDDFIAKAGPGDVLAGNSQDAAGLITTARELNTRMRKTQLIERALLKAERRAASTGSGGNLNNAIRQNIRAILDNESAARAFTKAERDEMDKLVRQGKMDDLLRWVGKFAPGGNGLIGMLQVGGTILNPAVAALPIAGMAAKGMADRKTIDAANKLQERIARGAPAPRPLPKPYSMPLLAAQGANAL